MKCPDLHILSLYQDGGLDPESARQVQEHLAGCASCEEQFRTLGKLGLFMRLGLGRSRKTPCLSAEELGAYLAGEVGAEHRERIEEHLAGCPRCLHEVAVFSDESFGQPSEVSPVPTRRALEEFALLDHRVTQQHRLRRLMVHSARFALAAAAAVLVVALMLPMEQGTKPTGTPIVRTTAKVENVTSVEGPVVTPVAAVAPPKDVAMVLPTLMEEGEMLVAEHSSLARFARQMRLILHQTMEASSSPTQERVAMLKEDVLSSGLVNSVEELSSETRDPRIQKFLVDCKVVLLRVAKIDENDASNDLISLVNEIRRMNLTELARLMELEGGATLWLASM